MCCSAAELLFKQERSRLQYKTEDLENFFARLKLSTNSTDVDDFITKLNSHAEIKVMQQAGFTRRAAGNSALALASSRLAGNTYKGRHVKGGTAGLRQGWCGGSAAYSQALVVVCGPDEGGEDCRTKYRWLLDT